MSTNNNIPSIIRTRALFEVHAHRAGQPLPANVDTSTRTATRERIMTDVSEPRSDVSQATRRRALDSGMTTVEPEASAPEAADADATGGH